MQGQPAQTPAGLAHLSAPELTCFALAWDAMLARTIPIGAVVIDESGQIIGAGRNAIFGEPAEGSLSGSHLAHAEINALLWLPKELPYSGCRLVTSLEPCQMCAGAIRLATIGALTYLGADPVMGTAWALRSARYVGHRPVSVTGPADGPAGLLAAALPLAFTLARSPAGGFAKAARQRAPELTAAAGALVEAGLFDLRASAAPWPEAAADLLAALS
jgi:tRNA(adenine34) deaminase